MKVLSVIFIVLFGGLLHFIYEWSHHNKYVALFAAVNESTWEHIKMALTAMFTWSLIDGFMYGSNDNYFIAKFVSLVVVGVLIVVLFYGVKFITKVPNTILDILEFALAITFAQVVFYKILDADSFSFISTYLGTVGMFLIFAFYMMMTMLPIENFLFIDPVTNGYGIEGHPEEEEVLAWEKEAREKLKKEKTKRKRRRH